MVTGLVMSLLLGFGIFFLLITSLAQLIFQAFGSGGGDGGGGGFGGGRGGGYSGGGRFGGGGHQAHLVTRQIQPGLLPKKLDESVE